MAVAVCVCAETDDAAGMETGVDAMRAVTTAEVDGIGSTATIAAA
jgi:hypothetical protein